MRPALVPLATGLAFGAYVVLRYAGLWMENDTTELVRFTRNVLEFGPGDDGGYPHGYAYTMWAAVLSTLTGLEIVPLVQRYTPLLGNLLLGWFGFVTFRAWLRSDGLGVAAAITLYLVPELVFTVSRGNHEKFTISLTLLAALAMLQTFRLASGSSPPRLLASWLITFYLAAFTTVTMNVFFGSTLIAAATVALLCGWILTRISGLARSHLPALTRELLPMVISAWVWVLFVTFYAYPTASQNLGLLGAVIEGFGEWVETSTTASDPYASVASAWASSQVYTLVSSFRWVLFGLSLVAGLALLVRTSRQPERAPLETIALLGLYGAFGALLASSIPVDFLDLSAGSNLQVRLYTYFALFAAPMAVLGAAMLGRRLDAHVSRAAWALPATLLVAAFAVLSVLKATVDPTVSNHWVFYQPSELAAITFWDERQSFDAMWIGATPRVLYPYRALRGQDSVSGNAFNRSAASLLDRDDHALASEAVVAQAIALSAPLSPLLADDRVYDNGQVQIYHRLPRTPYQR